MKIRSYKELDVWKKGIDIVDLIYEITDRFPDREKYGLAIQMQRAAVSIPSNIAEGRRRGSKKEFRRFLLISFGSGAELETQVALSKRLGVAKNSSFETIDQLLAEVMMMLNRMNP